MQIDQEMSEIDACWFRGKLHSIVQVLSDVEAEALPLLEREWNWQVNGNEDYFYNSIAKSGKVERLLN